MTRYYGLEFTNGASDTNVILSLREKFGNYLWVDLFGMGVVD